MWDVVDAAEIASVLQRIDLDTAAVLKSVGRFQIADLELAAAVVVVVAQDTS
jgi:hypothetical protein